MIVTNRIGDRDKRQSWQRPTPIGSFLFFVELSFIHTFGEISIITLWLLSLFVSFFIPFFCSYAVLCDIDLLICVDFLCSLIYY